MATTLTEGNYNEQVAAELARIGVEKADGNSLAGLDFAAIIAEHKKLATAARRTELA